MPPVFDRYEQDPHPWDKVLEEWLQSSRSAYRAVAQNLKHDHRVSYEREKAFDDYGSQPRDTAALENALKDFLWERIRNPQNGEKPDFLMDHNAENFVSLNDLGEDTDFVRVIDLHSLLPVFLAVGDKGIQPFDELTTSIKEDGEHIPEEEKQKTLFRFLNEKLQDDEQQRNFIEQVIEAMNFYFEEVAAYHPTWVTTWEAFESQAKLPAIYWSEAVGVYKSNYPRWIIVLRYKACEAQDVVRPTQLDAGWHPYHFPSPPQSSAKQGGHSMDLNVDSLPSAKLLPEYIHPQIKHSIQHWDNAGALCMQTHRSSSPDLGTQRTQHRQRLIEQCGKGVAVWLPKI